METPQRAPEEARGGPEAASPGRAPEGGAPGGEVRGGEAARGSEGARGDRSAEGGAQTVEPRGIPLGALSARDLLMWFLGLLAAKAWEGMGLIPDAATGKIQKNLEEARIGIDAYAAVLDVMRGRLDTAQRREVETVLTTLRLNFVEKSAGGGGGEGAQAP